MLNIFGAAFPLRFMPAEMYLPFLKMPLLAYQEAETHEQRIAWLYRAIADINTILACHDQQLTDLADCCEEIKKQLETLREALAVERQERKEEDKRLDKKIDDETAARIAADEALGNRIDDETAARIAADEALGNRIDDETAARIAADEALSNRIDAVESASGNLQQQIDQEKQEREACCEEVKTSITQIDTRVTANDDAISEETRERENADAAINRRIDNLGSTDFFIDSDMFYGVSYLDAEETLNYPITIMGNSVYGEIEVAVDIPPIRVSKSYWNKQQERVNKAYRIKFSKPVSYIVDVSQMPQQSYIWAIKGCTLYNVPHGYFKISRAYEILYLDQGDSLPRFDDIVTWEVILRHDDDYITANETPGYVEIILPRMYPRIMMTAANFGSTTKGFFANFSTEESIVSAEAFYIDNNPR